MRHALLHKSVALFLAMLTLVSGVAMTVSTHYCGGEIAAVSLFGEAQGCDMEQAVTLSCCDTESDSNGPVFSNIPCCQTDVQFHEIDGDPSSAPQVDFTTALVIAFFTDYLVTSTELTPIHGLYTAPPLSVDRVAITQSFLC